MPASSRDSLAQAGWACAERGTYESLMSERAKRRPFSWLSPAELWRSRNDRLARWLSDPTNDARRRWVAALGDGERVIERPDLERFSFLVAGDTGEGDRSQYALVPGLLAGGRGSAFMVVCSDVIYPAGELRCYEENFFRPYASYPAPIFAIPGNHDWYDGLAGFMRIFCDQAVPAGGPRPRALSRDWLRDRLWRRTAPEDPEKVAHLRTLRAAPEQQARQPGPYFAIDTGPLLVVGIDTGITGNIDRDQAAWLRRVSAGSPKPKVLLTGKPIYVDGEHRPGAIEDGDGTVDDIVRAAEHRYVAAIGGDIHNYQRYPVRLPDGRTIQYVVSGGGGAFMHATHKIPRVDLPGCQEDDFRCYPLRGDSLSIYSRLYDRRPIIGMGNVYIPPNEASALMKERLKVSSTTRSEADDVQISRRSRRAMRRVFPLPGKAHGPWHRLLSELLDWDDPPMFKSFLRCEVEPGRLTLRCLAGTGCREHEADPPEEDRVEIALA